MDAEPQGITEEEKKPLRSVGFAARRAAMMYMKSRCAKTATLKQCIAASSKDTRVPYSEIERYLAGAGARALFAASDRRGGASSLDGVEIYHLIYDDHDAFTSNFPESVVVYDVDASSWFHSTAWKRRVRTIEEADPTPKIVKEAIERVPTDAEEIY